MIAPPNNDRKRETAEDVADRVAAANRRIQSAEERDAVDNRSRVIVAGIEVPFGDLVRLYFKLAFAAIPTALAIGLLVFGIRALVG